MARARNIPNDETKDRKAYLPTGRPRSIGRKEMLVVYETLARGGSLADAADLIEVNYSTLRRSIRRDEMFTIGVRKATAYGKLMHLDRISKGARGWQSSAWFLQRKHWKDFKNRDVSGVRDSEATGMNELATPDPKLSALAIPPGAIPPTQSTDVPETHEAVDAAEVPPGSVESVAEPSPIQDDSCGAPQRQD